LDGKPRDSVVLDAPMLSSIVAERAKRRPVALAAIPTKVVQAVLRLKIAATTTIRASIRSA
jgi:hypothetical protein